ncbi:MAG: hypothetical protein EXX96DRAFT_560377 [Benjaminiella poitrasii]|nr:MAG: hypothetical protein EXX96DRAFT_560377 [Benjaminiella poitrasii]
MSSTSINRSSSHSENTFPTPTPGILRITLKTFILNQPVKRPYVTITLGDQYHKTSVSEFSQGAWNESFELKISYHNQLFDTIQLDLYDSNSTFFVLDKHVGRAEIRLRHLEDMPTVFTSYYEVVEKGFSFGTTSHVGQREAILLASATGAIQAEIAYRYRHIHDGPRHPQTTLAEIDSLVVDRLSSLPLQLRDRDRQRKTNSDLDLRQEFDKDLKNQRERDNIHFRRVEQNQDCPDESSGSDDESSESSHSKRKRPLTYSVSRLNSSVSTIHTVETIKNGQRTVMHGKTTGLFGSISSLFGLGNSSTVIEENSKTTQIKSTISTNTLSSQQEDDEPLNSYPILDTIGSWAMAKETKQVFRAILKLLAAFGQGFELSSLQILAGFTIVEKFYNDLPRERRTWDLVSDVSEIEKASYFWRYAMACYGWKGLNFIGKGNGILSDAVRAQSDALSICEHLDIQKKDLLAYELRTSAAFRPSYFIARDRKLNAIVLSIRGTMSTFDTMTDLVCEYEPWKGGLVHKGMKSSANWFFRHVAPKLIAYVNNHSTRTLYIVGHSLGASTAAILTIMLQDYVSEFQKGKDGDFSIYCIGYAPACGLSLDLANKYKDQIQSIVFADDFVSKLSYGSMMDVKELVIAGAEAAKKIGFGQLLWPNNDLDNKVWKEAFERLAECRKKCLDTMSNPRLYVAGTVYQFWLDPTPKNESRIVIERTSPERVSTELIIRMSIILDHLPTNFDLAFRRAMDSFHSASKDNREDGYVSLDEDHHKRQSVQDKVFESVAEIGLKGTTERGGEGGHVLDKNRKIKPFA